ncbi:MarR family winged helix-turn-helix transcriptional regulator [Streptomyces griseoincarnatus]|uniref:MarR family winged helix-turn-helix transcriptional regulator n=1 Tax=Streptomyces griseoincarnatus TaxID=29305 RepID=UPI0035ABC37E
MVRRTRRHPSAADSARPSSQRPTPSPRRSGATARRPMCMEARDLIRRAPDPTDGRGCLLALTETGRDTLREAAPTHLDSVRRHFVDRLEPEELAILGRIAEKIADEQ